MSFEANIFLELMPQTVVITTRASHNNYGEPAYAATGTTYRARVNADPSFIRNAQGETVAIKSVVWVASTGTIHVDDRLTLPDGTTPPIVLVEGVPDQDGTHHHKLHLGYT